ncbi:MAG: aldehyde dehydrogenase family protein, partial [Candidatus Dormibacteraceae bacterium]
YQPGGRLAPLDSAQQRTDVAAFLEPEAAGGAERVTPHDAPLPERGYYVHPTVFSHVSPRARIAREEIFGPVLSILGATDDDHAVALANDTDYGLSGAVWSDHTEAAEELAGRLRTGQVAINGGAFNVGAPFGGYKASGIGRELGHYGIEDTLQLKAIQR